MPISNELAMAWVRPTLKSRGMKKPTLRLSRQNHRDERELAEILEQHVEVRHDRARDDDDEDDDRGDPDGLVHPVSEGRPLPAHEHAERDREQYDREDLNRLRKLQAKRLLAGHEVGDREIRDERQCEYRDDRVQRCERDVQRNIAAEQVAVEVRRGAAG